ncbi:MAG: alanine/glycine:cation symporter family protein [Candidatus Babeliales bacterium]
MDLLTFFTHLNQHLAVPTSFLLFGAAFYLTFSLKFIQFRSFTTFFKLITHGIKTKKKPDAKNSITPLAALFTAMSTSLGIGTLIGPSVAIITGGPGAMFWLIVYCIAASILKYAEVTFAVHFRKKTEDGLILGGPMEYLNEVAPWLGTWYAYATVILFGGWSSLQANVIAETLAHESVPEWITGTFLAILTFSILTGGAKRVGAFSSNIVPFMGTLYLIASIIILSINRAGLPQAFNLIFSNAFSPAPVFGGFLGASLFSAIKSGIYKGAYITESGTGTAAIPHSMADVAHAKDQGLLAMVSVYVDTSLCLLSGLLVLTTDLWKIDYISNTVMYKIFNTSMPIFGRPIFVLTIVLFSISTVIGNSFNGRQSFAAITKYRWMNIYYIFISAVTLWGAVTYVPLVWETIEVLLPLVIIPNIISLIILSIKYRKILI